MKRLSSSAKQKRDFAAAVANQTTAEAAESVRKAQSAASRLQRALYRLLGGTEVGKHVPAGESVMIEARAADVREAHNALSFATDMLPALNDHTFEAYEDEPDKA